MKKKIKEKLKGFTLVELLAVIVILAVIMVITIPTVLGSMNKSKQKSFETAAHAMKDYLKKNYENCKLGNEMLSKYDTNVFKTDGSCSLNDNISELLINNSGYSLDDIESVEIHGNNGSYELVIKPNISGIFAGLSEYATGFVPYTQPSLNGGDPDLTTGLIPVVYDENGTSSKWFVADISKKWYSYTETEQWWANAVSVDSTTEGIRNKYVNPDGTFRAETEIEEADMLAMFVWIPRFSYTIGCTDESTCLGYKINGASDLSTETPGAIDIKFVSKDAEIEIYTGDSPTYTYEIDATTGLPTADRTPINWYTHPAFWWDENNYGVREVNNSEELSGIWVGKFRTTGSKENPSILPNGSPLRNIKIGVQFSITTKFGENTIYNIDGDTHMMKNSEWGAVAYLSQSIYGKYGNSKYYNENKEVFRTVFNTTGLVGTNQAYDSEAGVSASTTGNFYGIYDMANGADEILMSFNNGEVQWSNLEFDKEPEKKYYDKYNSSYRNYENLFEYVGHATFETKSWYSDKTTENSDDLVLKRGGSHGYPRDSGLFSSWLGDGEGATFGDDFRVVLIKR